MGDRLYDYERFSNPEHCTEEEEGREGEYEEEDVNDIENEDKSEELGCPFCPEDFDVLGLCCHIDADHRMEVKTGILPLKTYFQKKKKEREELSGLTAELVGLNGFEAQYIQATRGEL